ncbi:hypothetical protein [Microbacterium imperiale]|uniref:Uncharacterized protein n=1 Tax=Microbacterium imperiale TaxID=33884 RepID=A0A9W6HGG1_9MICO|nr:hypothetical protein [Microbacterium imperiale]MBP2420648.1 hypothetical protein [Microbacterium imperiale]MDS0200469.1 hypothetical protein [Microbacterium imperiale]BFE40988.1 hypothetical protein GCM10017544_19440 [Microbacterium imperiale]GLJ80045.1 hypothetical protein GCM10017586_17280 [Microbacterium imperiale]
MTDRLIVTDVAELGDILDRLDRAAAGFGWRVRRPADAAGLEERARAAQSGLRLPSPLVVTLEADPDAADAVVPVDAAALLRRAPVQGAVADGARGLHGR